MAAGDALVALVAQGGYSGTLLKGVTGSGKTEVYLEAVAECLRRGRQALVLLPEISLTADFLTRVRGALWRAACGVAFGRHHDRTAAAVADGGAGRGAVCGRRAVGVVPAVSAIWG